MHHAVVRSAPDPAASDYPVTSSGLSTMFENVGSVEWARLTHSHGTAEEVPAHLAALVGPSDGDRAEALVYFWNFMLHQGSRYEASPYIIPFLFEALEDAKSPLQPQLIDLLLGLAVGNDESF